MTHFWGAEFGCWVSVVSNEAYKETKDMIIDLSGQVTEKLSACSIQGEYKSLENDAGRLYPENVSDKEACQSLPVVASPLVGSKRIRARAVISEEEKEAEREIGAKVALWSPGPIENDSDEESEFGPEDLAHLVGLDHLSGVLSKKMRCGLCGKGYVRGLSLLSYGEKVFIGHSCFPASDNYYATTTLDGLETGSKQALSATVLRRGADRLGFRFCDYTVCDPMVCSQINGMNGEWTGLDDMPKTTRKVVGRTLAKVALGRITGDANGSYKVIADMLKQVNKSRKRARKTGGSKKAKSRIGAPSGGRAIGGDGLSSIHQLSQEATRYLLAYLRPFDSRAVGAFVPKPPDARTQKVSAFARFTVGSANNGGFLMCSPCVASDMPSFWYSDTIFSGTTAVYPTAANANHVFGGNLSNLPYNRAAIISSAAGSIIESRIVSYTVRVTYSGTKLNEGGVMYVYNDVESDSVIGMNVTTLGTKASTVMRPIDGKPFEFTILPGRTVLDDFEASNAGVTTTTYPYSQGVSGTDPTSSASNTVAVPQFLIWFASAASQTFTVEIVEHVEFIGTGVQQGQMTFCRSDRLGYEMCQSVLVKAQDMMISRRIDLPQAVNTVLRERNIRLSRLP